MSPPCATTIFDGDNGGATARGVSTTEIRIGLPAGSGLIAATSPNRQAVDALFAYFNQRYELYGRRLVPVYVGGSGGTPTEHRAQAAEVAAQGVFAAATGMHEWNNEVNTTMVQTLAHEGVVSVSWGASSWLTDRLLFDALHPYAWSVYPSSEDTQANLADFACRSLAGQVATHAGEAGLRSKDRRFGIVAAGRQQLRGDGLARALQDCTSVAPLQVSWTGSDSSTSLQTALERLRADGATTLICVCDTTQATVISTTASIGYKPEWILGPTITASGNSEFLVQNFYRSSPNFVAPILFTANPRVLPMQSRPWYGALASTGLMTASSSIYAALGMAEFLYPELLLLASGIQGAGPVLTADTFAQALMATQFPNPGAGQAPYYQPSAGFGPGDHSLYDDYGVGWWSDTAPAFDPVSRPTGSWCYLGQAARYRVGSYPADAARLLFNPDVACR